MTTTSISENSNGTIVASDGGSRTEYRAHRELGNDTLVAITTRRIYFSRPATNALNLGDSGSYDAGTEVYATMLADGWFNVRIPGTSLEQRVTIAAIEPA